MSLASQPPFLSKIVLIMKDAGELGPQRIVESKTL